jgi:hypothetical protein
VRAETFFLKLPAGGWGIWAFSLNHPLGDGIASGGSRLRLRSQLSIASARFKAATDTALMPLDSMICSFMCFSCSLSNCQSKRGDHDFWRAARHSPCRLCVVPHRRRLERGICALTYRRRWCARRMLMLLDGQAGRHIETIADNPPAAKLRSVERRKPRIHS